MNGQISINENKFQQSFEINKQAGTNIVLSTSGQYVNKDIDLTFNVQQGAVKNNNTTITATLAIANTAVNNAYAISASAVQNIVPVVTTPGFVSSTAVSGGAVTITGNLAIQESSLSTTSIIPETTASQTVTVGAGYYPTTRTIAVSGMSSGQQAILGSEGSVTTAPYVTIGGTNTMAVSATPTPYYFTRTGSVSAGTVQTKYKATQGGYTPVKSATNGGTVTVTPNKTNNTTIYIKPGSVTSSMIGGGITHSVTPTNIELDNANTSGIEMRFGSSVATATASITKTTGYIESGNLSNFIAASTAVDAIYVKGVTLQKPVSGTSTFYITFPNGADDTVTFHFEVDSEGNVTIN